MVTTPQDFVNEAIKLRIEYETKRIIDEEASEAAKRTKERVMMLVDKIALSVCAEYSVTNRQTEIIITVKKAL